MIPAAQHAASVWIIPVLKRPCPPPPWNAATPFTPPMKPISAAPNTMAGNGTLKKKIATNAAAASPISTRFFTRVVQRATLGERPGAVRWKR
jgi:hypothetical protein